MRPTTGKKAITAPGLTRGATREKTVETHSYAVLLTEIGGSEVRAVRIDGITSKYDQELERTLRENYKESSWRIKGIWRLCDADFEENADEKRRQETAG